MRRLTLPASTLVPALEPAAHARLVVPVGVAKARFQIRLLARNDAVADHGGQRQRKNEDPRTAHDDSDADVHEKKTQIDRIARVASLVGTGVPAPEKLRIPAATSTTPIAITHAEMMALIQWIEPILETGNGKDSR